LERQGEAIGDHKRTLELSILSKESKFGELELIDFYVLDIVFEFYKVWI